jgi:hypothetical protein
MASRVAVFLSKDEYGFQITEDMMLLLTQAWLSPRTTPHGQGLYAKCRLGNI